MNCSIQFYISIHIIIALEIQWYEFLVIALYKNGGIKL